MTLYEIGSFKKTHPLVKFMEYAECLSCKSSDLVISMHPKNIDYLETRGCSRQNFYHIPNGVDLEYWNSLSQDIPENINFLIRSFKKDGKKIIIYSGAISVANNIQLLIDVSKILQKSNVIFIVVGDGPEKNMIHNYGKNKYPNIVYLGQLNKACMPSLLDLADICYVGFKNSPIYKFGMSANKLWDYMMSSRPIVMSINSGNDPVKDANCGITVKSGKAEDVAIAFDALLKKPKKELDYLGENGKKYVIKNNNYITLSKKFLDNIYNKK